MNEVAIEVQEKEAKVEDLRSQLSQSNNREELEKQLDEVENFLNTDYGEVPFLIDSLSTGWRVSVIKGISFLIILFYSRLFFSPSCSWCAGPDRAFRYLHGKCFFLETREYKYELCPFDKITQQSRDGSGRSNLG